MPSTSPPQKYGPAAAARLPLPVPTRASRRPQVATSASPDPMPPRPSSTSVRPISYASRTSSGLSRTHAGSPPSPPPRTSPSAPLLFDDDDERDWMHAFPSSPKDIEAAFDLTSARGWLNALALAVLALCLLGLFLVYPILDWRFGSDAASGAGTDGYNLGGVNASGQVPQIAHFPVLVDADTPADAYTRTGFDGDTWTIAFSDEFNKDGRTFYDGDDPYWEAVDLNYWVTGDLEWYDPSAITTKDGYLQITITQEEIHDLNFKSGMLQSWNKMCFFRNAYVEVSVSLPGTNTVQGFWPGVWAMGNLGRPGYAATTDGTWPYTYSSCDTGILPNQTWTNGTGPTAATDYNGGPLSYLPGQRLSACTCAGGDHPGPSGVGRAAPEIDVLEAQINIAATQGEVSQSFQCAPFNAAYQYDNTSANYEVYNDDLTSPNSYLGGSYQQSVSFVTDIGTDAYYGTTGGFQTFGFEYSADLDDASQGYITWVSQGDKAWTMEASAIGPDSESDIGQRLIPQEPMALIFNLGLSTSFSTVDFAQLEFPNYMRIDYVRVYQKESGSIGCDPDDRPTASYIASHPDAYGNANATTWEGAGYTFPGNTLQGC
ncbi:hypothetical protein Q5752_001943 [Cryptotrichosporon argae]